MNGLTERLCRSLFAIPEQELSAYGARLVRQVWSRCPREIRDDFPKSVGTPPGGLAASDGSARQCPVETAAFKNAFSFAVAECRKESSKEGISRERVCSSVPVFAATALAEARGKNCRDLCYAVGVGMEAYGRFIASLASSTTRKGFDPHVLAASMAAIVACGAIEKLPPDKLAQAIGLGCSSITAVTTGYFPLQAAMAARDGIVMVLLVTCAFGAPPDALACRWGIYETHANPADMSALDLRRDHKTGIDALLDLFGSSIEENQVLQSWSESTAVSGLTADVFR